MSNTPELNRTDCKHRRPDSAEVRSRNLLRLTGSRILAGNRKRGTENGEPKRKTQMKTKQNKQALLPNRKRKKVKLYNIIY